MAGVEGAEKFANKLGVGRTYIVKPPTIDGVQAKDANEALLLALGLKQILASHLTFFFFFFPELFSFRTTFSVLRSFYLFSYLIYCFFPMYLFIIYF